MKNYFKNRQEKGNTLAALVVDPRKQLISAGRLQSKRLEFKESRGSKFITQQKVNITSIILTITFTLTLVLLGTTNSSAILQANSTTHKNPVGKNGAIWITEVRKMEATGQTMGLDETLDGVNATSENNGIDVHMMLPTEYGAVVILSASGYGNPGKLLDEADVQKRTTTGNSTGVFFCGNRNEILACMNTGNKTKYLHDFSGYIELRNLMKDWHRRNKFKYTLCSIFK